MLAPGTDELQSDRKDLRSFSPIGELQSQDLNFARSEESINVFTFAILFYALMPPPSGFLTLHLEECGVNAFRECHDTLYCGVRITHDLVW